ncbi:MAG TPA: hypothetical protein VLT82_07035 [Myxococcaceae bacterium]|nr:hypothetical protein [Myxococcaceae bacterium]
MRRWSLLVLALAGCAHAPPAESAAPGWKLLNATSGTDEMQVRSDTRLRRATVTDAAARGPDLDLKRVEGKLQGTTRIEYPVELTVKGMTITGRVAGDSWDLRLEQDGTEMRATGLVAGEPSTFWLSPARIRGSMGSCRFDVVWSAANYAGSRTCGPTSDVVQLQFPASLGTWSDPEVAALLAIITQR